MRNLFLFIISAIALPIIIALAFNYVSMLSNPALIAIVVQGYIYGFFASFMRIKLREVLPRLWSSYSEKEDWLPIFIFCCLSLYGSLVFLKTAIGSILSIDVSMKNLNLLVIFVATIGSILIGLTYPSASPFVPLKLKAWLKSR